VVDLMEALRQSVKGKKAAALRAPSSSKKTAKAKPGRRRHKREAA